MRKQKQLENLKCITEANAT